MKIPTMIWSNTFFQNCGRWAVAGCEVCMMPCRRPGPSVADKVLGSPLNGLATSPLNGLPTRPQRPLPHTPCPGQTQTSQLTTAPVWYGCLYTYTSMYLLQVRQCCKAAPGVQVAQMPRRVPPATLEGNGQVTRVVPAPSTQQPLPSTTHLTR